MLKKPARRNRRSKAYKSLPQNQCPSICRVCGNAATGYHYEVWDETRLSRFFEHQVPSCNGCKTFFRKTLIAGGELSCRRSNNCIDGTVSIGSYSCSIPQNFPFSRLVKTSLPSLSICKMCWSGNEPVGYPSWSQKFQSHRSATRHYVFVDVHWGESVKSNDQEVEFNRETGWAAAQEWSSSWLYGKFEEWWLWME